MAFCEHIPAHFVRKRTAFRKRKKSGDRIQETEGTKLIVDAGCVISARSPFD